MIRNHNYLTSDIRARVKKYDAYQHRTGSRRASPLSNDGMVIKKAMPASVSLDKTPIAREKRLESIPKINTAQEITSNRQKTLALAAVTRSTSIDYTIPPSAYVPVPIETKRRWWKTAMNIVGIAVFIFAAGVSVQTYLLNHQAKDQIAVLGEQTTTDEQGVVQGTGDNPSEEPLDETAFWSYKPINPEHPRYLRIPELSIYARVKSLGLTAEGAIDSPANIHDAGWYNKGAVPGSKTGSSLILGHVSGWTADGVFKKLNQMKEGMQFQVEKGSGEVLTYEVYKKQSYPVDQIDMQAILNADTPGIHDLKLMTCAGKFDASTETYADRLVVFARQVK